MSSNSSMPRMACKQTGLQYTMNKPNPTMTPLLRSLVKPELVKDIDGSDIRKQQQPLIEVNRRKKKPKQPRQPRKKLTRKEIALKGLYSIPSDTFSYASVVPLHKLWCGYMSRHLLTDNIPDVTSQQYNQLVTSLLKADFHGAKIQIVRSKQASVVGMKGIVVLDTKGTFKMVSKDDRVRTIPKNDSVFEVHCKDYCVTLFGKHLNTRPAERSVKKLKMFLQADLV